MTITTRNASRSLALLLCLTATSLFGAMESFQGYVEANEMDEDGTVYSVVLVSDDGRELMIAPEGKGNELLAAVGNRVEVEGEVISDEEGNESLNVTSFTLLESSDEEDE